MIAPSEREIPLEDLYGVGHSKMLGYLPVDTVSNYCGKNLDEVKKKLDSQGLFVYVLGEHECVFKGGAIYVAEIKSLQEFLSAPDQKMILDAARWPSDAKAFIHQVANEDAEYGTKLYDLIAMTFNNPLLTPEQRLHAYPAHNSSVEAPQALSSGFNASEISRMREKFNNTTTLEPAIKMK